MSEAERKSVSRHGIAAGTTRREGDVWYDLDAFLHDQVEEVLYKLSQNSLDDAIWGKIVVMEKNHRVAKVYLRNPTVIVDGSEEEFDGKTLGFNAFHNDRRDEQTEEIKQKIKEGVILKMDLSGNIKGMARGAAPVYAQGWRDPKGNCLSEKLIKMQGKITSDERAYKIFDMKRWKVAVERFAEGEGEMRSLLARACIRVSLAKDGTDMLRTPCWFAIVNLVAIDMLVSRCPHVLTGSPPVPRPLPVVAPLPSVIPTPLTAPTPVTPAPDHLPSIVAAVAAQMNQNMNTQLLNSEQLAQIASAVAAAAQNKDSVKKSPPSRSKGKDRRRNYRKEFDSDDSSEDSAHRSQSSSSNDKDAWKEMERWKSSLQSINLKQDQRGKEAEKEKPRSRRPRLDDVLFSLKTQTPSSTSDYDSTKEPFDSSSCSSTVSHSTKGIAEVTKSLMTHAIVHQNPLRDSSSSPTPLSSSTPLPTMPTPPPPPPPSTSPPHSTPSSSPPRASPPTVLRVSAGAVRPPSRGPHQSRPLPSPRPSSAANSVSYGVFKNATSSSSSIYDKPGNEKSRSTAAPSAAGSVVSVRRGSLVESSSSLRCRSSLPPPAPHHPSSVPTPTYSSLLRRTSAPPAPRPPPHNSKATLPPPGPVHLTNSLQRRREQLLQQPVRLRPFPSPGGTAAPPAAGPTDRPMLPRIPLLQRRPASLRRTYAH